MVTTHSEEEWRLLKSLRNQGRADGGGWLEHARLGYNYRLDDIGAALGLGQLEKLETILSLRSAAADRYGELLEAVDVELPCPDDAEHVRSWFVYVVKLPREVDRERVIAALEREGIATARYLPSIHLQAVHARAVRLPRGHVPRVGGPVAADAGAAVPRAHRAAGSGARRRSAGGRADLA